MPTERWVAETCADCGWSRERLTLQRTAAKGAVVPAGWHVTSRRGDWKTITARTRYVTLCGCDAE